MTRLKASAAETGCGRRSQTRERQVAALSLLRVSALLLLFLFGSRCTEAFAQADATPLNMPSQIGGRIAQCWKAPRTGPGQIIEVTVRLRFSSAGVVIGEPRTVYVHAPPEPGLRDKIAASILAAIKKCTPLPFTPSLGAAIAGRMLAIRFRSLPGAEKPQVI